MKDQILSCIHDPRQLEKIYRSNKGSFKREFISLYPQLQGNTLADFWNERLNYEGEEINWGSRSELMFVVIGSLVAGVLAKLPDLLKLNEEFFYPRNVGFIVFPILMAYFGWKNQLGIRNIAFVVGTSLVGLIFINSLPNTAKSDTLILSCIHLLLYLWCILGFVFVGSIKNKEERRLSFLKYNGDLVVITTLIVIAAAILSGITIGLFSLIGFNIEKLYFENVVIFGLPAAPIIGTYLIQSNPQLVGKVSPIIAKIFSPLVLIMLVAYLVAMVYSEKDPYNDRDFLLIFNALLIGVMAMIFFSVAEQSNNAKTRLEIWVLLLLSILTMIVNGIALSAIVFRITEWGITPNRAAILGGNILILSNLLLVTGQLFKVVSNRGNISGVGKVISSYLPVYFVWTIIVTFVFPLAFGFK